MAFKSFRVAVTSSDTDIIECPATQEGAAVLNISNVSGGSSNYTLKLYKQSLGTIVTIASAVAIAANTPVKYPAPISLEAGDKLIMTAPSNSIIVASGTFTYSGATPAAVGFTPKGDYSSVATYDTNDYVHYTDGNTYVSLEDENTDNAPDVSPASWMILAAKGDTGAGLANVVDDTTPQLGGQLDVNGFALGDGTLELLKFTEVDSAVNELTVRNAATGNAPALLATGDDTNIDLNLVPKGTGKVKASGVEVATLATGIPQNSRVAAYTIVATDSGYQIFHPTADNNARTFTIPANASVAFSVGTVLVFINEINTLTIAITSDTLVFAGSGATGSRSLAPMGIAVAIKKTSTSWLIAGVGLS